MFVFIFTDSDARLSSKLGINYGVLGDNLPSPLASRSLIDSINSGGVKIYDADPSILKVLSNTNIPISIMVPNQLIPAIGTNLSAADQWVKTNLLPFIPDARIRYLLVGNEILSDYAIRNSTWGLLVPAIVNIKRVLTSLSVKDVKVGTTMAMDVLSTSFPPSAGEFRKDIAKDVVSPMLKFLRKTRSFFFIDAYPYFVWSENWKTVSLYYALLDPKAATPYVDAGTKLVYKNMLEQMLDAVAFAMEKLGYSDVPIAIAETGWPNAGDYDQIGANPRNAATYNRNLARWVKAGKHTPVRPKKNKSPSFVFSLFDENQKPGRGTERHWGVFYPNGSHIYALDLSGRTPDADYPFHSLESAPSGALPASQSNIWFPQIHEADDQSRSSLDTAADCDSVSNNGSGSGESDDPKDKVTGIATATRPGTPIPGCDVDKRDKIRQKNEKKHQRQREKRAQELHERCSSFLMTRKLETLSQKLVPMGFPVTQATQALILNEGRIEDSVSWLLSEGKHVDAAIVDDGRPLKIDISEELATISDLEVKFKCSKQEVERLVISHEGDLEKSLLDLKMQKLETHVGAASQKVEDSSGRALANGTNKVTGSPQNPVTRLQPIKSAPAINIQHPQPREDRDINRSKMVTEDGSRNPQSLRGLQAKTEWIRPQTSVPPMEHRWSTSSPSPSVSHTNLASQHAQAMLSAKSAAQYALTNNEINNGLKPIIMMQRPQSMTKQNLVSTAGATGICTSPPLNAGRYSNGVSNMEMMSLEQKIGRIALNSQNRDFHPSNPLYFQPNHLQSSVANLTNNGAAAAAAETLWGNASTRWGSLRPPKNPCRTLESSPGWSSTNSSNVPPMLDYTSIDWSHGSTPQFRHNSMANLKMDRLHETWSTSFMGRCNGLEESGAILLANGSSASMASKMWTSPFAGNDLFGVSRKSVASSPTPQERGL